MKKVLAKIDWKYSLYVFITIIVCLEIFGRLYLTVVLRKSTNPKFQFDSYRIYSHIPNFNEGDGKKDWIKINGQGFRRNSDVSKIKNRNTFRVFLMGGSAAHGISTAAPYPLVHIYMDETIDYYLEQNLKSKYPGKNFEVINAAVTGYQVFQHTPYILSELLDYQPDLFIFMDGANDHFINNPKFDYFGENRYQFWKPRLQTPSLGGLVDYSFLWMSKHSGFARGYYSWRMNRDAKSKENTISKDYSDNNLRIEGHKAVAKNTFLRSIETNISILQANSVDVIICLQPMLVLRKESLLSKVEREFLNTDENTKTLYPAVTSELSQLSSKYNVPFIDMNLEYNLDAYSQKQLLVDYCHLSPLGAKVIANRLLPEVDGIFGTRSKKQ